MERRARPLPVLVIPPRRTLAPLECSDDRCEAPGRQKFRDLARQTLHPCLRISNGIDVILKDDLLRRMRKAHHREPAPVGTRPSLLAGIDPAVPQQKAMEVVGSCPSSSCNFPGGLRA